MTMMKRLLSTSILLVSSSADAYVIRPLSHYHPTTPKTITRAIPTPSTTPSTLISPVTSTGTFSSSSSSSFSRDSDSFYATPQFSIPSIQTASTNTESPSSLLAVASASLLLASNTIGAGCLVLPQLVKESGFLPSLGVFLLAYGVNLVSGLSMAHVAIQDYHNHRNNDDSDTTTSTKNAPPSSFQELAANRLGPSIATMVSLLSIFVNLCALSFGMSRVPSLFLESGGSVSSDAATATAAMTTTLVWAAGLGGLVTTQSNQRLSQIASVAMAILVVSFGSLLLPGLANVHDPLATLLAPGTAATTTSSIFTAAPVILMAMVFQNIVPSIVKLLHYNWKDTVVAISLGSALPLVLYLAYCFATLGGGISMGGHDTTTTTTTSCWVTTVFSVVTVFGSSLGSIMSLSEEVSSYLPTTTTTTTEATTTTTTTEEVETATSTSSMENDTTIITHYSLPSVLLAMSLPLAANLILGDKVDFTPALAIAGSVGSPLLYGVIPAMMMMMTTTTTKRDNQVHVQPRDTMTTNDDAFLPAFMPQWFANIRNEASLSHLVPVAGWSLLGLAASSTTNVGHELLNGVLSSTWI